MAAPLGKIVSSFPRFKSCFFHLKRHFSIQKCTFNLISYNCTRKIQDNALSVLCTRDYSNLLRVPDSVFRLNHDRCIDRHQCRNSSSASALTDEEVRKEIDTITDKFMEAKDYLDDAKDSVDTVYFNDDMKDAEDAIKETLAMYGELLEKLDAEQRGNVTRTIGLKMEELKAQLDMIKESLHE